MAEQNPLKIHNLRPAPGAKTAKTRVGRGEASKGKTAGRGTKGTKARYQVPERFEGGQMPLHMRLPKLKGFKNPFKTEYQVVNLDKLTALYPEGGDVTPESLATLATMVKAKEVSRDAAREVLTLLVKEGGDPRQIVDREGLGAITAEDDGLGEIVDRALAADPDAAEKVRAGNMKAIGPLVGYVMRETKGRADGGEITRLIRERLGS